MHAVSQGVRNVQWGIDGLLDGEVLAGLGAASPRLTSLLRQSTQPMVLAVVVLVLMLEGR